MTYSLEGYVDVAQRIRQLREKHPLAVLRPADPANPFRIVDIGGREFIVYTAACYRSPDDPMPAIACAAEPVLGRTNYTRDSELMNAETSAWGRAIMAALAVDEPHIASANEVRNRQSDQSADTQPVTLRKPKAVPSPDTGMSAQQVADVFGATIEEPQPQREQVRNLSAVASQKQIGLLQKLAKEKNIKDLAQYAGDTLGRPVESVGSLSSRDASAVIKALMATEHESF